MLLTKDLVLGIDTSNYTTSVALTDKNQNVIEDRRRMLRVRQGERGLRQSNALFQHQENLPALLHELLPRYRHRIGAVSVSSRPRPQEGSYMPVFLAGCQTGRLLSDALDLPYWEFSHQEGHLKAASFQSGLSWEKPFLAWHLSGGTCELLLSSPKEKKGKERSITVEGGSLDISFGQLFDRLGVALGFSFPCGSRLDEIAMEALCGFSDGFQKKKASLLKPISIRETSFNLSGMETQAMRLIKQEKADQKDLVSEVFSAAADCLFRVTETKAKQTGLTQVLFTGGVCASRFLRERMELFSSKSPSAWKAVFGDARYSSDNAVGISILGGECLWG